jgi:cytochrome b subunit of formate dehydrogenase/mono/diheme cytochrome c family protein
MNSETRILRFSVAYRIEHWVLTLSFGLLALTGLVQSFMDYGFARQIIGFLGGIENVRLIHHLSAIVMMLQTIYHLGTVGYRMLVERQRMTMLPGKDDVVNALQALRYNLGLAKSAAREGRYTFAEKLEYWAVIWGTVVMGATGFMLWNPIATTKILPGDFVPAAKAAHAKEALLAVLAILIWHFYHAHLRHLNLSIFTGFLTREEVEEEHPLELERIRAGQVGPRATVEQIAQRRRIYLPIYGVLAIGMLAGVYFFVAFEETAISTVPPAEQVAVYVPLTPTPIPTPAPTLTPAPLETVPALEAETAVSWQSDIASLMDEYCVSCHGPATAMGGLDLSSYAAALAGGDSGPAVVPGEGHTSLLITRQISGDHPGQLSREQLDLVSQWIEAGAPEEPSDVALPTAMPGGTEGPAATEEVAAWESNIGSLVQEKCVSCHNDTVTMGGLDLSSYESTLEGGVNGPAVVAGDANVSQIVIVQRPGDHPGQFTDEELELMIAWIEEGAPEN